MSVTGNLSANAFIGDGSGLTGIALGDNITSGTTNITANENTSLTFTTAGSQRMIIDENGYVGIGKANPIFHLDVVGNANLTGSVLAAHEFNAGGYQANIGADNYVALFSDHLGSGMGLNFLTRNTSVMRILNPHSPSSW